MKNISTFLRLSLWAILFTFLGSASAQIITQRFVARMITHSATDSIRPISGVSIVVDNAVSKASDAQGRITASIPLNKERSFKIQNVRLPRGSNLVLVSPSRTQKLFLSNNECVLIFTTTEEKDKIQKATYQKLLEKYNLQRDHILQLRTRLEEQRINAEGDSAQYTLLTSQIDSLQTLLNSYYNEDVRNDIFKQLQNIAESLSASDYQSTDSVEQRIYELQSAGDWETLSSYIRTRIQDNTDTFLQEADARYEAAKNDYDKALQQLHTVISSFKDCAQNDSAAYYYELLASVDSTHAEWLDEAGVFELNTMKRYDRALNYFTTALRYADTDTLRASVYFYLGNVYAAQGDPARAKEYLQKALEIATTTLGEDHPTTQSIKEALAELRKKK